MVAKNAARLIIIMKLKRATPILALKTAVASGLLGAVAVASAVVVK